MQVAGLIPAFNPPSFDRDSNSPSLLLASLHGKPLLEHVIERTGRAEKLKAFFVATSNLAVDDPIAEFCERKKVAYFRGEPGNFLGLLLAAYRSRGEKGCVLIPAAQPLIDPAIIDNVANLVEMTDGMLDWVGTNLAPAYPKGMDVEGFTIAALEDSDRRCADADVRAQGTLYIRQNSRLYRILSVKAPPELNRPDLSFKAETEADLANLNGLLANFQGRTDFTLGDLIALSAPLPAVPA